MRELTNYIKLLASVRDGWKNVALKLHNGLLVTVRDSERNTGKRCFVILADVLFLNKRAIEHCLALF